MVSSIPLGRNICMLKTPTFIPPAQTFPRTANLNIQLATWHYRLPVAYLKLTMSLNKFLIPKFASTFLPVFSIFASGTNTHSYSSRKIGSYICSLPLQHSPILIHQHILSILPTRIIPSASPLLSISTPTSLVTSALDYCHSLHIGPPIRLSFFPTYSCSSHNKHLSQKEIGYFLAPKNWTAPQCDLMNFSTAFHGP